MDFNKLISRVKAILLTPSTEWPVIDAEQTNAGAIWSGYIVWLALVPVIFGFLKSAVFGYSMPFLGNFHLPMGMALTAQVTSYVLALIGVFVVSLIINALAPSFGGTKNSLQALKVAGYAYTASWVAGIGAIVPGLGLLILLAGAVYSIYLLYLGLPVLMKCPKDKAAGYTAVVVVIGIVIGIVFGILAGSIAGTRALMQGGFATGNAGAALERLGRPSSLTHLSSDQAAPSAEAARAAAGAAAVGSAISAALGDANATTVEALAPDRLKGFLPDNLSGLKRGAYSAERNAAMGMQFAQAKARYDDGNGGRGVDVEIVDMGSAKGMMALASWAGVESEQQSDHGFEKTYRQGDNIIHEQWDNTTHSGEYSTIVAQRFNVEVKGTATSMDELRALASQLDLRGLAALRNEGVKPAH